MLFTKRGRHLVQKLFAFVAFVTIVGMLAMYLVRGV